MDKWQSIILEWVNCLKIIEPVTDLSVLSTTDFFPKILNKLCKKQIEIDDLQKSVRQFIKDAYPEYELENNPLNDMNELLYVCSLLMHYCAINAEDESIREPLCRHLSSTAQSLIMYFIQSILNHNGYVTRDIISAAIAEAYSVEDKCEKFVTPYKPRSSESLTPRRNTIATVNRIGSLTDFIQSPEARRQKQLEQLTRDIRRLKVDLATELDEKFDLQQEIKTLNDKVISLEKELESKIRTIQQLKNDFNDQIEQERTQSNEISGKKLADIKKLRSNIKTYQEQVENLQQELNVLENTNHTLKNKLSTTETERAYYQQNYLEYEAENKQLAEHTREQARELNEYKSEISELKQIIDELKNTAEQQQQHSSVTMSDSFTTCDNLGGEVIELQLRESLAAKEIVELKLTSVLNENATLQRLVDNQQLELCKYKEELNELNSEATCMKNELESLKSTQKIAQYKCQQLEDELNDKKVECNQLAGQLDNVNQELKNTVQRFKTELVSCNVKIDTKTKSLADLKLQLDELNEINSQLSTEINAHVGNLNVEIDNNKRNLDKLNCLQQDYDQLKYEMGLLTDKYNTTKTELDNTILDLRSCEKRYLEVQSIVTTRDQTIKQLENQIDNLIQDLKLLEQSKLLVETELDKSKHLVIERDQTLEKYQKQLKDNQDTIEQKIQEIVNYEKEINNLNIQLNNVRKEITQRTVEVDRLVDDKLNLGVQLERLQSDLNATHTQMDDYRTLLEHKTSLCTDLELTNTNNVQLIADLNTKLNDLELINETHQCDLKELKLKHEQLEKVLNDERKSKQIEIDNLKQINCDLDKKCKNYEENFDELTKNHDLVKQQLMESKQLVDNLEKRIAQLMKDQTVLEQSKIDTINSLNIQIYNLTAERDRTVLQLKNMEYDLKVLEVQYNDLDQQSQDKEYELIELSKDFKRHIQMCEEQKKLAQQQLNDLNQSKSQMQDELNNLRQVEVKYLKLVEINDTNLQELQVAQENYMKLDETHKKLVEMFDKNTKILQELVDEKAELVDKLTLAECTGGELKNQLKTVQNTLQSQVEDAKIKYEKKLNEIEQNQHQIELLMSEKEQQLIQIEELEQNYEKLQLELVAERDDMNLLRQQYEQLNTDYTSLVESDLVIRNDLNSCKSQNVKQIQQIDRLNEQIEIDKYKLNETNNKNKLLDLLTVEQQNQIEHQNQQIKKLNQQIDANQQNNESLKLLTVEQQNQIEVQNQQINKLNQQIDSNQQQLNTIIDKNKSFELKTIEQQKQIDLLTVEKLQQINNLNQQINENQQQLNETLNKNESLMSEIELLRSNYDKIINEFDQQKSIIESLIDEKTKLHQNILVLDTKLIEQNHQIDQLKNDVLEADKIYTELELKHQQFVDKVNDLQQQLQENLNKTVEIEADYQRALFSLEQCQRERDQLKAKVQEVDQLDVKLMKLEQEKIDLLTKSKSIEDDLVSEMNVNRLKYEELLVKYTEVETTLGDVTKTLESTKTDYNSLLTQLKGLQHEKDDLVQTIKLKDTEICNYVNTVDELGKKLSAVTSENTELINKIKEVDIDLKQLEQLRNDKAVLVSEIEVQRVETTSLNDELKKLREAYETVLSQSKSVEDNFGQLKLMHQDKVHELSELKLAYECKFKECDNFKRELDDMKAKRLRDREEIERQELEKREMYKNYDSKLEKMKIKMKQLYTDEIGKAEIKYETEKQGLCKQYEEKIKKMDDYVNYLKAQLWNIGDKYLGEQSSKPMQRFTSFESLPGGRESTVFKQKVSSQLDDLFADNRRPSTSSSTSFVLSRAVKNNRVSPEFKEPQDLTSERKRIQRNPVTGIGQGLPMEDEEVEMFNTNYFQDLQVGRCVVENRRRAFTSTGGPVDKVRLSELQMRNSLCPPHLKSSYPAETQFQSPSKFKEEELKAGNIHLDDSLNTCLLPEEKQPRRKDRVKESTSYKKPGPPTPSKNGGRASLQGSETREILREQNFNEPAGGGSNRAHEDGGGAAGECGRRIIGSTRTSTGGGSISIGNRKSSTPNRIMKAIFSSSYNRNNSNLGQQHRIHNNNNNNDNSEVGNHFKQKGLFLRYRNKYRGGLFFPFHTLSPLLNAIVWPTTAPPTTSTTATADNSDQSTQISLYVQPQTTSICHLWSSILIAIVISYFIYILLLQINK